MRRFIFSAIRALLLTVAIAVSPPWAISQPPAPSPWRRPESSRALLQSLGLKLDEIEDRKPTSEGHLESYLRVLARLEQLPLGLLHEWSKNPPVRSALLENPSERRGDLFRLEGFISSLERVELPKELAERFDLKEVYRLGIVASEERAELDIGGELYEVWTSHLPSRLSLHEVELLPASRETGEVAAKAHVKCDAVFLSVGTNQDRHTAGDIAGELPVFVTSKLAWLPLDLREGERLTPSNLALSKAKFDIGLLDPVRAESSKRLTPEVTEPFLQMLAAQSRVDWETLDAKPLDLASLISSPNEQIGEAIEFDAIARRIVEIPLENDGDRKRLNLDRYYQIDLIIPKPIRTLVKDKEGVQREVEQHNFPLTLCIAAPPEGLAIGEDIRESIHAKAFFFKLWAYESKFAQAQAPDAMQVSPLLIAASVQKTPPPEVSATSVLWLLGGASLILAVITVWGYLLLRNDDGQQRLLKQAQHTKSPQPPPSST
jgi:hypothetical protein